MCKCIKRVICLAIIAAFLFIGITIWGKGGDKFRLFGEKSKGVIQRTANRLADKADELKEKVEGMTGKVREWKDKRSKEESTDESPKKMKEPSKGK